jgi:hypothetical protein
MLGKHGRLERASWLMLLAGAALALGACGGGGGDAAKATATVAATQVATSAAVAATPAARTPTPVGKRSLAAARAKITLDGKADDWAAVPGMQVPLKAIPKEFREDPTAAGDVTATLKVATDGTNVYVLMIVPDTFTYNPDPAKHRLSPAVAVQWQMGTATPQMASAGPQLKDTTGMVDIWHWELDCGPGAPSGGTFPTGNDPKCNLDDEYATLNDEREDDKAESSLTGSWDHTGRAKGPEAAGEFVFEIARPLRNGDAQDAQFQLGSIARIALAYWDGSESQGGWTDAGHAVSVTTEEGLAGWIEVALPT